MMGGRSIKPLADLPQSSNPWAKPGEVEGKPKGWKIDSHWLYCSYEEFMRYLHKRERELAELKRAKEAQSEN